MASMYYGERRSADIWDEIVKAAKRNYTGPVVLAHDAMVIDIASDK
jgi:hypothetical protein